MDVKSVTSAATQLLDSEAALKSVKRRGPAATAAAPAKRFPLVPVLGGVGGVGVLAVIAVLTLGKGGGGGGAGADSTGAAANQPAQTGGQAPTAGPTTAAPTGSTPNPQTAQANPRTPATRQPSPNQPPNTAANTAPPAGAVTPAVVEDSAGAATRADQAGRSTESRRLARWVFYQPAATNQQKADMAELIATTYENDQAQALQWLQSAYRLAVGNQRTRLAAAIQAYGGTP